MRLAIVAAGFTPGSFAAGARRFTHVDAVFLDELGVDGSRIFVARDVAGHIKPIAMTENRMNDRLAESMGVRPESDKTNLAPQPSPKDIGRRPLRNAGKLAIDQVLTDPHQPRVEFDLDAIERLAQSIRDKGQLSAIHVRWSESHAKWVIVAGERRYRAAVRAGLPSIDCYFHERELTESEILEQQLNENLLREDLQLIEEAHAFEKLIQLNDWCSKQLAESVHIPPSKVTRSLALLKLPPDLQQQVTDGILPARAAYELSKLATATSQ